MHINDLENFYFEPEWIVPFNKLHEGPYITKIFEHLKILMGDQFYNYQFIYYYSNGNSNPAKPIILNDKRPKVLIWNGEETSSAPIYMKKYFKVIFKTFLNGERDSNGYNHLALGYSRNFDDRTIKSFDERSYNVFFSGNLNTNRIALYKSLSGLNIFPERLIKKAYHSRIRGVLPMDFSNVFKNSHIRFTDGFARGYSKKEYSDFMYDARLIICPKGFTSNETFRHYEALMAGAIPISLPLPDNYFYRGAPFVILNHWNELEKTVKYLLSNPILLEDLHRQSVNWWENVCSEKAVAEYMVKIISR
jgi:hypothetical protein